MANTFYLSVVAPDGQVFGKDIEFVVVPGQEGELGILPNHAKLITALKPGVVRYTENDKVYKIAVSGGFMEVADNKAIILADAAETADTIDVERAKRAKERAEKRLREKSPEVDILRAEMALKRAIARLQAVEK
jgi:F-type H+-transporting ATPase subunit epsilon